MLTYSPTDLQVQIRDLIRKNTGIERCVTDQQIYDAVGIAFQDTECYDVEYLLLCTKIELANMAGYS